MGSSKAELPFCGMRLIEYQLHRLRLLGIEDILIAGYKGQIEGGRTVPDLIPHRGPLSGIHAGLSAAARASCLVLSVDAPLVPFSILISLMQQHLRGITALTHDGQIEPLIGIYDRSLSLLSAKRS